MNTSHTVVEYVTTIERIDQLAEQGRHYDTIKIDPDTDYPVTLAKRRHHMRHLCNKNAGANANENTLRLNNGSTLFSRIYIQSELIAYPHHLRLMWCEDTRQIFCSYYPDQAKCFADVRTKVKAVKFLNQHIPSATEQHGQNYWRDVVAEQISTLSFDPTTAGWEIKSTNSLELGVEIYGKNELCKGGSESVSCMTTSTKGSLWHTEAVTGRNVHPIYAYLESPDVRLCYITDKAGEYIARWIAPKNADKYCAIYAANKNYLLVLRMLQDAGWVQDDEQLRGCRLAVITTDDGRVLMPYIDSRTSYLDIDNQSCGLAFLTRGTGYDCDHSTGTLSVVCCACCGGRMGEDAVYIESTEEMVCDGCCSEHYVYANTGRHGGMYVQDEDDVYYFNGEHYTIAGLNYHNIVVLDNGDCCSLDDAIEVDGDYYHIDDCSCCPITGEYFLSDGGRTIEGVETPVSPDAYMEHATNSQFDILVNMESGNIPPLADVLDSISSLMDDSDLLNEDSIEEQYNAITATLIEGEAA